MPAYCDDHNKYTPGCPDCIHTNRMYQAERKPPTRPVGRPTVDWGIRSPANWKKFHDICKRMGLQ